MVAIQKFTDLLVWQKAHVLTLYVYELTDTYPKDEIFGLTNQTRRCAVSVPSNIVEGFKRRTKADSIHFYNIAEGSLEELKYQVLLAKDRKYITLQKYNRAKDFAEEVGRLLYGWKNIQKYLTYHFTTYKL